MVLEPTRSFDALFEWLLHDGAAPLNRTRLREALAFEARAVPDPSAQIGKESVRMKDRAWKDGLTPFFDVRVFDRIEAATKHVVDAYGYRPLATAFRAALAPDSPGLGHLPSLLGPGTRGSLV